MSKVATFVDLDHAAGCAVDPQVLTHMLPYYDPCYRNPSSMHAGGRSAHAALEDARATIARALGARSDEILFTSSGTESDNLAVFGSARAAKARGNHVIVSSVEHKAVLESARALTREGFDVTILPVDGVGRVDPEVLRTHLRDETVLVSIILGNNEIGTVNPLEEIAQVCRGSGALLHTDACQALAYLPLQVSELGVDLMTFNSAKIGGPPGIAALYKRRGVKLAPLLYGGEQEQLLRPGTEALPLAAGFAHAVLRAVERRETEAKRLALLRARLLEGLTARVPGLLVNGDQNRTLPHIASVTVPGVEGEAMLLMLDAEGIRVSTGSACSAFDLRPSHVLSAIGQASDLIHGSIRFSLGRDTTRAHIDRVLVTFPKIVARLRAISAVTTYAYAHAR